MKPRVDYSLYLCTDRGLMTSDTIEEGVELAIKGGVTIVQLREKECQGKEFLTVAQKVKEVTDAYEVPLIINDRIDIALAVDADGVHLGQQDIPAAAAREILGANKIIGVSAYNAELALQAQKDGASVEDISAGLSISIVKNAVLLHGGTVEVEKLSSGGLIFTIILPAL